MSKLLKIIGFLIIITGCLTGLYVGGWVLFIKPIIDVCKSLDAGSISYVQVGWAVIKYLFCGLVGWAIAGVGYFLGLLIIEIGESLQSKKRIDNLRKKMRKERGF